MKNVIPAFWYEPLVLTPKLKTSNEEEDRRNIDGVGPSSTRKKKKEPIDLKKNQG
jgi:hypothetical protein